VTRLVLWRHGLTRWNSEERMQGHEDVELSATGRAQARAAAPALAEPRPDLIVSSDLHRAADTAAELAALTGRPVEYDERLRERCYGDWQGLRLTEIERLWPEEYARWRAGAVVGACGVEDLAEVGARVRASLLDAAERAAGGTVVLVGHGGAMRYGLVAVLGWPQTSVRTLAVIGNCHWVELRHDAARGWQLRAYNVAPPVGAPGPTPPVAAPPVAAPPVAAWSGPPGSGTEAPTVASE
jgi:glucosyl-3-phosphoglycerate phosphatase